MDGFLFLLTNKTHRERLRKMFLFLGTNPSVWEGPQTVSFFTVLIPGLLHNEQGSCFRWQRTVPSPRMTWRRKGGIFTRGAICLRPQRKALLECIWEHRRPKGSPKHFRLQLVFDFPSWGGGRPLKEAKRFHTEEMVLSSCGATPMPTVTPLHFCYLCVNSLQWTKGEVKLASYGKRDVKFPL